MLEVIEINRLEDLEGRREVWDGLFSQMSGGSFFQTFDWTVAYLRSFGRNKAPRLLFVYEHGQPIGIAPMIVCGEETRIGAFRVLTYPLADWGTFYGPIGPAPEKTLSAALGHIRRTPRDWDLLDIRWTPPAGVDRRAASGATAAEQFTLRALEENGFPARRSIWKETALVDLEGSWEGYLSRLNSRFRSNLRRAVRRTESLGAVELVRHRPASAQAGDGDPRWDLYDACVELAERSWQGASHDGTTLSHPEVRGFLRETHALAARLGMVDMNLLLVGGKPAAFGYNYHHQGAVLGLRAGYDGQFASAGVGVVLYASMFQDSFARQDRLFDLGPGSLESKRRWLARCETSLRFTHYPWMAPRAQLLRVKHWLLGGSAPLNHAKGALTAADEN